MDAHHDDGDAGADELLRRALIDAQAAVAVALKVQGLPLAEELTVIFHGRQDLGTIQTYVANGRLGAGASVAPDALLRVPCDLDLGDAGSRDEAEDLYESQARALRDALVAADTVLSVWREPLARAAGSDVAVLRSVDLPVRLPAHRLMPVALVAPDRHMMVAPVCGARTLADGRPPLGIACAQQDVTHVYPLPDDPDSCLEDFVERSAAHAHRLAERLEHQEASVRRFLELNDDFPQAG